MVSLYGSMDDQRLSVMMVLWVNQSTFIEGSSQPELGQPAHTTNLNEKERCHNTQWHTLFNPFAKHAKHFLLTLQV